METERQEMNRWPMATLGEIAGGGQYGLNAPAMSEGTGVRFVRITDITQAGELRHEEPAFVPIDTPELDNYELKDGDVLIARSGATAGKSYVHHSFGARTVFAGYLIRFQPDTSKVLPRFVGAFLQTPAYWQQLNSHKRAVAQPNVNAKQLASLVLPMPPLAEQERIVKLLDEADELRKLRAQADRRTADLIPALFHEMFGDPGTNSKGWPVKPFGDLANNQDGKRKPVKASDRAERKGEYPYYGASGIIDYVEEYLFDETALLIGEDGANLLARSTPIAFLAHGKYWVNNHAHVVTDNGKADLNYLCIALNLRDLTDYVTGSAQPKLNQANMNRMPIPVPPLPLQKEFAARVSDIRAMQAEQAASRRRLDELFQSMLHRAFNGEL